MTTMLITSRLKLGNDSVLYQMFDSLLQLDIHVKLILAVTASFFVLLPSLLKTGATQQERGQVLSKVKIQTLHFREGVAMAAITLMCHSKSFKFQVMHFSDQAFDKNTINITPVM